MRYVLNKRRTDKTKTKLTETTLITQVSIHTNQPRFQDILIKNTLVQGLDFWVEF